MHPPLAGVRVCLTLALGAVALALLPVAIPGTARAASPAAASAPDHPTTRHTVVAAVLDANPTLAAARHAWQASTEVPAQVGAPPDPVLTWGLAPASLGAAQPGVGQRVELRQALPFPGTLAPRARAAEAHAEALADDLEALRRALSLEAARLVDELGRIEASLDLLDEHATLLAELKASAEARYAAGTAGAQDPIQADVALAHVEHQVVVLQAERRVAVAGLNALMHTPVDAPVEIGHLVDPPEANPDRTTDRPELLAARAEERAAAESLEATRRASLPDLMVMGTYSSMWMQPDHRLMVGVGIEVPLQLPARRAEIREAEARSRAAASLRQGTEDALSRELESARARYAEARHVLRLYDHRLLPAARTRVRVAHAAFESGSEDFDTLIDAERGLRGAELGRAEAVAQVWTRHAELLVASGRPLTSPRSAEVSP